MYISWIRIQIITFTSNWILIPNISQFGVVSDLCYFCSRFFLSKIQTNYTFFSCHRLSNLFLFCVVLLHRKVTLDWWKHAMQDTSTLWKHWLVLDVISILRKKFVSSLLHEYLLVLLRIRQLFVFCLNFCKVFVVCYIVSGRTTNFLSIQTRQRINIQFID